MSDFQSLSVATPSGKTRPPDWTQRDRVRRDRLLRRLARANGKRLISVLGPAGSGKSILLSQHFEERLAAGAKIGWITLDRADTDAALLLNGFVRALEQTLGPAPRTIREDALAWATNDPMRAVRRLLDWPRPGA
jgi:ATP/maltotriose-dependent transcriptional regulator MalT